MSEESQPKFFPELDTRRFEGIDIQWSREKWTFNHANLGKRSIDTYSIWNPLFHDEIAQRLAEGQRCALYMMGNYGVAEVRSYGKDRAEDAIFDEVKKRGREQTLVVFAHPFDIGEFIDTERLPQAFKDLQLSEKRLALYPGPMHMILPVDVSKMPDIGKAREEREASFFWMPGHFGYESLAKKIKGRVKGLIAGGSLNIHGQEPSYSKEELKAQIAKTAEWQENIDFVIFDEISESSMLGRSHTQISFTEDPPKVLRVGALSPLKFERETGIKVAVPMGVKNASYSKDSPYDKVHDAFTDTKIDMLKARMARFKKSMANG